MRHRLWIAMAFATVALFLAFSLFTAIKIIDWIFGSNPVIWIAFLSGWAITVLVLAVIDLATNEEQG